MKRPYSSLSFVDDTAVNDRHRHPHPGKFFRWYSKNIIAEQHHIGQHTYVYMPLFSFLELGVGGIACVGSDRFFESLVVGVVARFPGLAV